MSKIYAGIGSRSLSQDDLHLCFLLGAYLGKLGWTLHTGAAQGADQAFANGALSVGGKVNLFLPWYSYEEEWVREAAIKGAYVITNLHDTALQSVDKHHPNPKNLSQGVKKLHARNYMIVEDTKFVLAIPSNKIGKGGTGQGMRVASSLGKEVIDLSTEKGRKRVEKALV